MIHFIRFKKNTMRLIGIVGKKGVGKDTMADYLCQKYGYQKRAFADPLKKICQILFELEVEQLHDPLLKETIDDRWNLSPRQMFQRIGTDLFRNHYDRNIWLEHFTQWYYKHREKYPIVCNDVRFQNECDLIHQLGGIVVKIEKSSEHSIDLHESESVDISPIDFEIKNEGTIPEFYEKISEWIKNDLENELIDYL